MSDATSSSAPRGRTPRARRFQTARTVGALMLREMSTTYGKSALGYVWALVEPIAGIMLLTFVFALAFSAPPLGDSFPLFYATGIVPLAAWMEIGNKVGSSLQFSRQLLAYPGVTFLDAIMARFLLNAATHVMIAYVVLGALALLYGGVVAVRLEWAVLALALAFLLALGTGTLNCYLITRLPAYGPLWMIATRPLFIVSCVFYLFEAVPEPYRSWLWFNPLVHVVALLRRALYVTYDAEFASPLYVALVSMTALMVGLMLLRREASDLLER